MLAPREQAVNEIADEKIAHERNLSNGPATPFSFTLAWCVSRGRRLPSLQGTKTMTKTIKSFTKTIGLSLALSATALTMAAAPTTASAMSQKLGGVIGCNASGGKQEAGAVIGGLLGAVAGNK